MRRIALFALLAAAAPAQDIYDVVLKGGHVIDPKNKRNGQMDIGIAGARISKIAPRIPAAQGRRVVDAGGYYVTPGLIDIHVHFDAVGAPLGLNPDHNALRHGVTTAVDAGSAGWKNFETFRTQVIDESKTRVLAFLNVAGDGVNGVDAEAAARIALKHPGTVVGISASRFEPAAFKAAELSKLPVLADLHTPPGEEYRAWMQRHLRPGDIQTHLYAGMTPPANGAGRAPSYVQEARKRGILFDVGHGSGSFLFRIAAPAIRQGFLPDTISSCLDKQSAMLPVATMTNVMSKLLALGMTLDQVIERATSIPARAIRRTDIGSLEEGGAADIAVLDLRKGQFAFLDSGHRKLMSDRAIRCVLTIRGGDVVWDTEGLSLADWKQAGPYSNFK